MLTNILPYSKREIWKMRLLSLSIKSVACMTAKWQAKNKEAGNWGDVDVAKCQMAVNCNPIFQLGTTPLHFALAQILHFMTLALDPLI